MVNMEQDINLDVVQDWLLEKARAYLGRKEALDLVEMLGL